MSVLSDKKIRNAVWKKTGGKCYYCGIQTKPFGTDKDSFCIDHMKPRTDGGGDEIENLFPCCSGCNTSKSNKSLFSWLNEKNDDSGERTGITYFELHGLPFDAAWK